MNDITPRMIGRRVLHFPEVDSTNTVALAQAADPANDGLVVLADVQTAGRGRLGRTWSSPPDDGLLLSVLLFPPEPLRRPALLTILAAVAVCETIYETTQLNAALKWPNDVYVRGKKVCGILVEQSWGAAPPAAIIGIGLNVNTDATVFADAGLDLAASLAMFTGQRLDRSAMLGTLLRLLDQGYADLRAGSLIDLESRWRWHGGLLGREVRLTSRGETLTGRLIELGFAGIVVETPAGAQRCFAPEAVTELRGL
jgi:BirA family biotin operon repressor/biotin-[acetyl-CoA-carboxylase] ligase